MPKLNGRRLSEARNSGQRSKRGLTCNKRLPLFIEELATEISNRKAEGQINSKNRMAVREEIVARTDRFIAKSISISQTQKKEVVQVIMADPRLGTLFKQGAGGVDATPRYARGVVESVMKIGTDASRKAKGTPQEGKLNSALGKLFTLIEVLEKPKKDKSRWKTGCTRLDGTTKRFRLTQGDVSAMKACYDARLQQIMGNKFTLYSKLVEKSRKMLTPIVMGMH